MLSAFYALLPAPRRRNRFGNPRADELWTPAEDRRLLRAVARVTQRHVEPWQAKPTIDWGKIAKRHGRSVLAVQARVSVLRAAPRIVHGLRKPGA